MQIKQMKSGSGKMRTRIRPTKELLVNTCEEIEALFESNDEDSKPAAITNKRPKYTVSDDSNGSNLDPEDGHEVVVPTSGVSDQHRLKKQTS